MHKISILRLVLFFHPCPVELFEECFTPVIRQLVWPYRFRSRGTTGSSDVGPCFGPFCVVVDVSRCLDTLTWVQAGTASAVCGLTITPITFAAVICDADGPCLVNAAYEPESTFTMPPRSTTRPLYFGNIGSNSEFLRWHMSFSVAKWTLLPSFCATLMTSLLLFTLVICHAGIFSSFSHSLSTAVFASGIFTAWGMRTNLYTRLHWLNEWNHLLRNVISVIFW